MNQDRRITLPLEALSGVNLPVEATFIPQRYEPNYAYPLLVLFHGRGGDEQQLVKALPSVSWRNYVGLGLRGPEVIHRKGREVGYGWGPSFNDARHHQETRATDSPAEIVRKVLEHGVADAVDVLEEGVFAAVRKTRSALHIHSERIFLVGCGEGAAVAYRMGLAYPERFAGVVAINGWLSHGFRPLARWSACRDLRVLVVHGEWNARAPIDQTRREVALLRSAGLRVAFQSYPCAHRLTSPMWADVDTWLINQCVDAL